MAAFSRYAHDTFDETDGQRFEDYVKLGTIEKSRFFRRDSQNGLNVITTVFTLKEEGWRVPLYRLTMKNLENHWNEDLEILEGTLLGYSLPEMAEHMGDFRSKKQAQ